MPAKSRAQQEAMAIAEHNPSKLYARNSGLLKMSHNQLHDFAATKGLSKSPASKGVGDMHSPVKIKKRELTCGDNYR